MRVAVFLLAAAAVISVFAVPLILMDSGAGDGSAAVSAAKRATAPAVARLEDEAEGSGEKLMVAWSVRPMGGMQMVEVSLRVSSPGPSRRAAFMVDPAAGNVEPQDALARQLTTPTGPGG